MAVNYAETFGVCQRREELPAPAQAPARRRVRSTASTDTRDSSRTVQVLTLVLWMGCLTVGGLGFTLPYLRPMATPPEPEPVQAEFLNVELTHDELPAMTPAPAVQAALPAPAEAIVQPSVAQPVLVSEPSPAIAFAMPVAKAPSRIVPSAQANYSNSNDADSDAVQPPARTLTFGRGEGKQPAPEYPLLARRQGQQGAVKVRLAVGTDGRVVAAEAAEPCEWSLLNESAVQTISRRWRFSPGPMRLFEVVIRFQLGS